jgi:hypothetical protein
VTRFNEPAGSDLTYRDSNQTSIRRHDSVEFAGIGCPRDGRVCLVSLVVDVVIVSVLKRVKQLVGVLFVIELLPV